jgi:hypothetical protein
MPSASSTPSRCPATAASGLRSVSVGWLRIGRPSGSPTASMRRARSEACSSVAARRWARAPHRSR